MLWFLLGLFLLLLVACFAGYVLWDRWDNQRNEQEMKRLENDYRLYAEWQESQKRAKPHRKPLVIQ